MWVHEYGFPRINHLGDLVDRGNGGALTISAGSIYDGLVVGIVLGRFA